MDNKLNVSPLKKQGKRLGLTAISGTTTPDCKRVAMRTLNNDQVLPGAKEPAEKTRQRAAGRVLHSFMDMENQRPEDKTSSDELDTDSSPSETAEVTIRSKAEFDFGDRLGRGGYGRVYKAQHRQQKTFYAIKVVPDRGESHKEVEALSSLKHCNIVQYFSCWMENSDVQSTNSQDSSQSSNKSCDSFLYIQLELCKPETLRDRIDQWNDKEDLPDSERREESWAIILQIVTGVEYIHTKSFTHRDLKPANILFGLDGKVKIGDFGLVTTESDDTNDLMEEPEEMMEESDEIMEESDEMMEESDEMMEEPEYQRAELYMAPEQLEKIHGRKIDIFPLGLIYFELLWKLSTYHERAEIWGDLRKQKYPEKFPKYFDWEFGIVNAMLNPNPENRPEASALKEDLEKYICTRSTSVSVVTTS